MLLGVCHGTSWGEKLRDQSKMLILRGISNSKTDKKPVSHLISEFKIAH